MGWCWIRLGENPALALVGANDDGVRGRRFLLGGVVVERWPSIAPISLALRVKAQLRPWPKRATASSSSLPPWGRRLWRLGPSSAPGLVLSRWFVPLVVGGGCLGGGVCSAVEA